MDILQGHFDKFVPENHLFQCSNIHHLKVVHSALRAWTSNAQARLWSLHAHSFFSSLKQRICKCEEKTDGERHTPAAPRHRHSNQKVMNVKNEWFNENNLIEVKQDFKSYLSSGYKHRHILLHGTLRWTGSAASSMFVTSITEAEIITRTIA